MGQGATGTPAQAAPAPVPDALAPLGWLLGTWVGVGVGGYPTIDSFHFGQEITVGCDGRPFLSYQSRTWLLDEDGNQVRPLATEFGFWRVQPGNQVELLLAHPTGYAEVWVGEVTVTGIVDASITGARAELHTDVVARTASSKDYTAGRRLYGLVDGELMWAYDMAAVGQPMTPHLSARLKPS